MSRDKQIEEMAKDFCALNMPCEECHLYKNRCHAKKYATRAYNAGYRKSTDVAEEIFSEVENTLKDCLWFLENHPSNYPTMDRTKIKVYKDTLSYLAELKKKYVKSEET